MTFLINKTHLYTNYIFENHLKNLFELLYFTKGLALIAVKSFFEKACFFLTEQSDQRKLLSSLGKKGFGEKY